VHAYFDCTVNYWNARAQAGENGFWISCAALGSGNIRIQSIMHPFRNKRTGASEQELSDRERHMVVSGQEWKSPVRRTALLFGSALALSLSVARDLPEPRGFRCPAHVCVHTAAHEAADGLID
jgi:hypothetical protein